LSEIDEKWTSWMYKINKTNITDENSNSHYKL
jgi:hypothetical protein